MIVENQIAVNGNTCYYRGSAVTIHPIARDFRITFVWLFLKERVRLFNTV